MANLIEYTERRRESNHIISKGFRGAKDRAQVGNSIFHRVGKYLFREVWNSGFREVGIFLFPHMGKKAFRGVGKYPCHLQPAARVLETLPQYVEGAATSDLARQP